MSDFGGQMRGGVGGAPFVAWLILAELEGWSWIRSRGLDLQDSLLPPVTFCQRKVCPVADCFIAKKSDSNNNNDNDSNDNNNNNNNNNEYLYSAPSLRSS